MTTPTPRAPVALLLAAALSAAGCLGTSPPTHFYVLSTADTTAAASASKPLSVAVGPVGLAGYLDRPQLVTRPAADRIDIAEFDQWGEPLRDGITRVLAENLARQMPSAKISTFPWRSLDDVHYQVAVDVTRLDGPAGGDVSLEARWRILDAGGKEVTVKTTRLSEPPGGPGYPAAVAAMSRAMAALSRDIAQALATLPQ